MENPNKPESQAINPQAVISETTKLTGSDLTATKKHTPTLEGKPGDEHPGILEAWLKQKDYSDK